MAGAAAPPLFHPYTDKMFSYKIKPWRYRAPRKEDTCLRRAVVVYLRCTERELHLSRLIGGPHTIPTTTTRSNRIRRRMFVVDPTSFSSSSSPEAARRITRQMLASTMAATTLSALDSDRRDMMAVELADYLICRVANGHHLTSRFHVDFDVYEHVMYDEAKALITACQDRFMQTVEPDSDKVCAVCLAGFDEGTEPVELPCSHAFHSGCVVRWFEQKASCPYCRHDLKYLVTSRSY